MDRFVMATCDMPKKKSRPPTEHPAQYPSAMSGYEREGKEASAKLSDARKKKIKKVGR
jgi:hypothetical protein